MMGLIQNQNNQTGLLHYNNDKNWVNGNFNIQGVKGGDLIGRLRHTHIKQSEKNKDLDNSRTPLNYVLGMGYSQILQRLKQAKEDRQIGKQANEMIELVSSLNIIPSEQSLGLADQWARASMEFFNSKFKGQVLSCAIHMNESSIHIHLWILNQHPNKKGTMIWGNIYGKKKDLAELHQQHNIFTQDFANKNGLIYKQENTTGIVNHFQNINEVKSMNESIASALAINNIGLAKKRIQQLEQKIKLNKNNDLGAKQKQEKEFNKTH